MQHLKTSDPKLSIYITTPDEQPPRFLQPSRFTPPPTHPPHVLHRESDTGVTALVNTVVFFYMSRSSKEKSENKRGVGWGEEERDTCDEDVRERQRGV